MLRYATPQRLGAMAGNVRATLGRIDMALHTGARVYRAVSSMIPESEAKSRVSRAVDDYTQLREKVRKASGL